MLQELEAQHVEVNRMRIVGQIDLMAEPHLEVFAGTDMPVRSAPESLGDAARGLWDLLRRAAK